MGNVISGAATALFLLASLAAMPTVAADVCGKIPARPEMPQGASASDEDMKEGHDALQKYVNRLEEYQKCMEKLAQDAPPDTKPEVKQQYLANADAANQAAHEIADVYSIQLRAFKSRQ